jgi:sugar diacid utilization regulator
MTGREPIRPARLARTGAGSAPLLVAQLDEVAAGGAADAGGLPVELLGDFLSVLSTAVVAGTQIGARQLRSYRTLGDRAARDGVALRALLDLYLSSAWRLWRLLPPVAKAAEDPQGVVLAGEVMLHAVDDVVASLTEGYQLARRALVREQESARREFIDDLLSGGADVGAVLQRAAGFGLDLAGPHAVAVVESSSPFNHAGPLIAALERAVQGSKGDAQALLASKDSRLVVVFPAPDRAAIDHVRAQLGAVLGTTLAGAGAGSPGAAADWQLATGRPRSGADGVAASYRESLDALSLAHSLGMRTPMLDADDLLAYQVVLRDRAALADLVATTLGPLRDARGGARPLIETLGAYFAAGANTAQTARALHLSVRAVTYRLGRIQALIGRDPADPREWFGLQVAVLGARLLGWPLDG